MKPRTFDVNGKALTGISLFLFLFAMVWFGPIIFPTDPIKSDLAARFKPPSWDHPLGTDALGRCLWARILWGGRVSLGSGVLALFLALSFGVLMATVSVAPSPLGQGLVKGIMDMTLALPGMVWALLMLGITGPSIIGLILGLAAAGWAWWARFCRSLIITALAREFVLGGRMAGVRGWRLWARYVFPQIWPQILTAASLRLGWTILLASALGFLGLGAQPPTPEWGGAASRIASLYDPRSLDDDCSRKRHFPYGDGFELALGRLARVQDQ